MEIPEETSDVLVGILVGLKDFIQYQLKDNQSWHNYFKQRTSCHWYELVFSMLMQG